MDGADRRALRPSCSTPRVISIRTLPRRTRRPRRALANVRAPSFSP